jgi:uncharacterized protein
MNQKANYPWHGDIKIALTLTCDKKFALALRIPGWCKKAKITVNGEKIDLEGKVTEGYAMLERLWKNGDTIEIKLGMNVELIQSNPKVRANAGKLAIKRGPLVYCIEEIDNGANLSAISLDVKKKFKTEYDENLLGGAVMIHGEGTRTEDDRWGGELYRSLEEKEITVRIKAVPYFLWGNRESGEMMVWIKYKY